MNVQPAIDDFPAVPNPALPHTYPRRVLVAATGLSPQVVTETIYALAVASHPPFVPTEIHLLTTTEGRRNAQLSLLQGEAWLPRLCAEYDLPQMSLPEANIHVIRAKDAEPLPDIRTVPDNTAAADMIAGCIRMLTNDHDCALHVSIAGGRKTMGYYTGYALSLYGRPQDRLSHVLVSAPFESLPAFFFPSRGSRVIHGTDGRPHDAHSAKVTLATIPFVQLRDGVPEGLLTGDESFGAAVKAVQSAIGPPELILDLASRRVSAGGQVVRLPPRELAFLAWLARRCIRRRDWVRCPAEGTGEAGHGQAFLTEYRAIIGEMGNEERTATALAGGMTSEFFSQTKSRLNSALKGRLTDTLGAHGARSYQVATRGPRSRRRFGLELRASHVRFASLPMPGAESAVAE